MAQFRDSLTDGERLALALLPGAPPTSWNAVRKTDPAKPRSRRGLGTAMAVSLAALAGVLALEVFTIRAGEPGAIFFPPGASEAQAFNAIVAAGGLPIRATTSVFSDAVVWIAAAEDPAFFSTIIGHGALVVVNPLAFSGCFLRSA
jgi:hypothetical protein